MPTVAELKQTVRSAGLSVSARKAELERRVSAYHLNTSSSSSASPHSSSTSSPAETSRCARFLRDAVFTQVINTSSGSESGTIVAMARFRGREAAVKTFFNYSDGLRNRLKKWSAATGLEPNAQTQEMLNKGTMLAYESTVYETISRNCSSLKTRRRDNDDACSNLVKHIITAKCPSRNFDEGRPPIATRVSRASLQFLSEIRQKKQALVADELDVEPDEVWFIVTDRVQNAATLQAAIEGATSEDQVRSYLLQTIAALAELNRQGIQHNDLHLGNILVDTNPVEYAQQQQQYLYYSSGSKTWAAPLRWGKVYLFDWDQAYCEPCGPNLDLEREFCPKYGICSSRNPRFDIYTVMRLLQTYCLPPDRLLLQKFPEMCSFISEVVEKEEAEPLLGRMCHLEEEAPSAEGVDNGGLCVPYKRNEPRTVLTPTQVLLSTRYFDAFLV